MQITRENLESYIYENTCIEIIIEIDDFDKDYFDVLGECGGDYLHYRVRKDNGAIYAK